MMNERDKALFRAAVRTFEELSFLLPTEEVSPEQEAAEPGPVVRVRFRGARDGCLLLSFRGDPAPAAAANMLGQGAAPDRATAEDALKELGNVICGNFLPSLAGPAAVYRLDAPALSAPEPAAAEPGELAAEAVVGLESGLCRARVFVLPGPPREVRA
ncbi:MAG: chemotaxis protein CheX [Elusimicrobia bacterium]|nr:chemotaxis protein CheX [Elusimicrobiota bacterium]